MVKLQGEPRELTEYAPRDAEGVECICGGYAIRVDTTDAEREQYGCGRPYSCCDRAFECRLCKTRLVGRAEAPEME
jgi:hypothetical protein